MRPSPGTLLLAGALLLSGCASTPGWYRNPPKKKDIYYGAASATSADEQMAIAKAQADARGELAQQMSTYYGGLIRRFREEMGSEMTADMLDGMTLASKQITSTTLIGSRPTKREIVREKGRYVAYVLLELPTGEANTAFVYEMKKNAALYARLQKAKAMQELDKELEAFNKSRTP
jgi:hypothetical protein